MEFHIRVSQYNPIWVPFEKASTVTCWPENVTCAFGTVLPESTEAIFAVDVSTSTPGFLFKGFSAHTIVVVWPSQ